MQLLDKVPAFTAAEQSRSIICQSQLHCHKAHTRIQLRHGRTLTEGARTPDVLHVAKAVLCTKGRQHQTCQQCCAHAASA
jgi:hypothetical protein